MCFAWKQWKEAAESDDSDAFTSVVEVSVDKKSKINFQKFLARLYDGSDDEDGYSRELDTAQMNKDLEPRPIHSANLPEIQRLRESKNTELTVKKVDEGINMAGLPSISDDKGRPQSS